MRIIFAVLNWMNQHLIYPFYTHHDPPRLEDVTGLYRWMTGILYRIKRLEANKLGHDWPKL